MASMSLASKLVLGGGVLLLIDSFLSWQKVCVDFGALAGLTGQDSFCGKANAWQGNGSLFGFLMGISLLILLGFEVANALSADINLSIPMSKLCAYLGFGVLGFTILKFLFSAFNHGAVFAYIGLVLALVVGYGSWLHFQEPVAAPSGGTPPPTPPQTSI